MEEKVQNLIPTLYAEMESDGENESEELLNYCVLPANLLDSVSAFGAKG
jgi:hypothetical protein